MTRSCARCAGTGRITVSDGSGPKRGEWDDAVPRPGSTRQARAGLEYAMGTVARANALVAAWRWRYELAAAAGLAALGSSWAPRPRPR